MQAVAQHVRENVRATDAVVRWGGEEFMVILPETDVASGAVLANKLHDIVKKLTIAGGVHVTASFGVTQLQADEGWEQLVSRADALMYRAKEEGRDRVAEG